MVYVPKGMIFQCGKGKSQEKFKESELWPRVTKFGSQAVFDYCRYRQCGINRVSFCVVKVGKWSMIRVNVAEKRLLHFLY